VTWRRVKCPTPSPPYPTGNHCPTPPARQETSNARRTSPKDAPAAGHGLTPHPGSSRHAAPRHRPPNQPSALTWGAQRTLLPLAPVPRPARGAPNGRSAPARSRLWEGDGQGERPAPASAPGSPPASNACKNKPTERQDLPCFCVPCTERKTLPLRPLDEIKTPPAHNKFTIGSISPTSPRARAQLPGPPTENGHFGRETKSPAIPPGTSRTPAGTNFARQEDFPEGAVWVL